MNENGNTQKPQDTRPNGIYPRQIRTAVRAPRPLQMPTVQTQGTSRHTSAAETSSPPHTVSPQATHAARPRPEGHSDPRPMAENFQMAAETHHEFNRSDYDNIRFSHSRSSVNLAPPPRYDKNILIVFYVLIAAVTLSLLFSFITYGGYVFSSATGTFEHPHLSTAPSSAGIDAAVAIVEPDDLPGDITDTDSPDTDPPIVNDPVVDDPDTDTPIANVPYDFSSPVPKSDTVSDEYIKKSVFIGDSRTEGLWLYSKMKATFLCERGLNVKTARENGLDKYDGLTVLEVLKNSDCENIYVSFGINEIGWVTSAFISTYEKLIDDIRAVKPDAKIYVQNIFPMSKESHDAAIYGNNDDIRRNNDAILKMCEEKEIYLLDVYTFFADENGNLKDSYDTGVDGAHFKAGGQGYADWTTYIKTHAVD